MDKKTEVMISLGAAIGSTCIPCFDHLYARSKELGIDDAEISKIIEIGLRIRNGASMVIKSAIQDTTGDFEYSQGECC